MAVEVLDVDAILWSYAAQWASKYITLESEKWWSGFKNLAPIVTGVDYSRLEVVLTDFQYEEDYKITPSKLVFRNSGHWLNDTEVLQPNQRFSKTHTTTASFEWSLTEGLKLSTKTSFKAGLPILVDGKVELTTELSFSATEKKTESTTQTWTIDVPITLPAYSIVDAHVNISQLTYSPKWTAKAAISGPLQVRVQPKCVRPWGEVYDPWPAFPEQEHQLDAVSLLNNDSRFTYKDGKALREVKGTFTGIQGIQYDVDIHQSKIPKEEPLMTSDFEQERYWNPAERSKLHSFESPE